MKNQITTRAIVLKRINYQEADRIITVLTPDKGSVSLIAKGARRAKSKLAGGIELFCINQVVYIPGRGEVSTLVSSRMQKSFQDIAKDIDKTMLGYEFLKIISKLTQDEAGQEYFEILEEALEALRDSKVNYKIVGSWFYMKLLDVTGHRPRLDKDLSGNPFNAEGLYEFSFEGMGFVGTQASENSKGAYQPNHIKLLKLILASDNIKNLIRIQNSDYYSDKLYTLSDELLKRVISA
jgi:DNA repair protein RecO (recombination protein O)